jgi:hypothetical protein
MLIPYTMLLEGINRALKRMLIFPEKYKYFVIQELACFLYDCCSFVSQYNQRYSFPFKAQKTKQKTRQMDLEIRGVGNEKPSCYS